MHIPKAVSKNKDDGNCVLPGTLKYSKCRLEGSELTFITEIPKHGTIKNELVYDSDGNERIIPDIKNGTIRIIPPIPYTYGFISNTLSSSKNIDPWIGLPGDGDCLDAFFIDTREHKVGEAYGCHSFAALKCADSGEADWKLLVSDTPLDDTIKDHAVHLIKSWLLTYKEVPLIAEEIITEESKINDIIRYHTVC